MSNAATELVARYLRRRKKPDATPIPPVAEQFAEAQPPRSVRQNARMQGDLWTTLKLLKFSVATNIIFAGLMIVAAEMASRRPVQMIATKGDLREQIRAHFADTAVSTTVVKDPLVAFLHIVLPIRHGITPSGAPFLVLLQGLMTSELYEQTAATVQRNLGAVQTHGMSESLMIEGVTDIDEDRKLQRVSVVVTGRLLIQATQTARGAPMALSRPYRAIVVLDVLPASKLNPYGYFIVSLREATSEASVQAFDREQETKRARANGKL